MTDERVSLTLCLSMLVGNVAAKESFLFHNIPAHLLKSEQKMSMTVRVFMYYQIAGEDMTERE